MPDVSVVVPVYNVEGFLRKCLDSLVAQTLRDIEIVCVDDGSTDASGRILDEYAARDARMRVLHQSNSGAGAARNAGVAAATGEYLFFCDPDDWADDVLLERLYGKAHATRADVLIAGRVTVSSSTGLQRVGLPDSRFGREKDAFAGMEFGDGLFTMARAALWDKLFRRAFIKEENIRFQCVRHTNDLFFTAIALAVAKRIAILNEAHYYHFLSKRPDGLQNSKDRAPFVFLEVFSAIECDLVSRGLSDAFSSALAGLLLRGGVREISMLRNPENVTDFYTRFRKILIPKIGSGSGAFKCLTRFERSLVPVIEGNADPASLLRRIRRRNEFKRMRDSLVIMLHALCGKSAIRRSDRT